MKKICYVTTMYDAFYAFIKNTANYLQKEGDYEVSVIFSPTEKNTNIPNGFKYFPVKMERGFSWKEILSIYTMYKIIKKEKFDIVQYSTPNAAFAMSVASWLCRVPVRLYCQWGMVYVGYTGIKRWILYFLEWITCQLSTVIEPDSHSNRQYAIKNRLYSQSKSRVIWNGSACGVDLEKFDVGKKEEWSRIVRNEYNIGMSDFVVGFIGRVQRDKGVNELLNAVKSANYDDNTKIFIVGNIEESRPLDRDLLEWAKKNKNIIFTGFTSCPEKFLAAFDLFVLPSYREGFGNVIIEAEAMEVPVIVTNIPGPVNAMVNFETGLVVEPRNSKQLEMAITFLKKHKKMREEFGRNGGEYVRKNFDSKRLFEKILKDRNMLLQGEKDV